MSARVGRNGLMRARIGRVGLMRARIVIERVG